MSNGRSVLKKTVPLLLILALAIGGAVLLVATRPQAPAPESKEKEWVVATLPAEPGRHVPVISLYGRLESAQSTQLTSALSTDVLAILCEEGERVEQDQPLVQLDDRAAQLRLKQRRAEVMEIRSLIASEENRFASDQRILRHERELLALAQQEVARARRLKEGKLSSQARIDEAQQIKLRQDIAVTQRQLAIEDHKARLARLQAQLQKAESLQAMARLDLEHSLLRAPFDGRITRIPASPGNRTRPGEVLVELYALDTLRVRAQIPSTRLASVEAAMQGEQPLGAHARLGPLELTLQLRQLSGDIKPGRGGRDGLFTLTTPPAALAVGAILPLQLQLPAEEDTLALPREALYGNDRIYTIVDGRLKGHRVERLGETLADDSDAAHWLLVRSASIGSGEPIVVTQLPNAVEGLKVRTRRTHAP